MNCKPVDIAKIVSSKPEYFGRLVEVLYFAPNEEFVLPDGIINVAGSQINGPAWVIKCLGRPLKAKYGNEFRDGFRMAMYGVANDRCLRPLRDQDGEDEMLRIAGKDHLNPPQTIIPNTAEVFEIARQANAQHLHIVTDGVRTLLSPHVPVGWQKISVKEKRQPA